MNSFTITSAKIADAAVSGTNISGDVVYSANVGDVTFYGTSNATDGSAANFVWLTNTTGPTIPIPSPSPPWPTIPSPFMADPEPDVREPEVGPIILDADAMIEALRKYAEFLDEIEEELDENQEATRKGVNEAAWALKLAAEALEKIGQEEV
jgi:hypothetical protein